MKNRINSGWMNWRESVRYFDDKRVPIKLKGKFYKIVVRKLTMVFVLECLSKDKKTEQEIFVTQ